MKTPPWAESLLKLEKTEGKIWQEVLLKHKAGFQKSFSKYQLIPKKIELVHMRVVSSEALPKVGSFFSLLYSNPVFVFLPLNTQEFLLERLLGGKGLMKGHQGMGVLGKKSIESMMSALSTVHVKAFESLRELSLELKSTGFLEIQVNLIWEKTFQFSFLIPWEKRKSVLKLLGEERE